MEKIAEPWECFRQVQYKRTLEETSTRFSVVKCYRERDKMIDPQVRAELAARKEEFLAWEASGSVHGIYS